MHQVLQTSRPQHSPAPLRRRLHGSSRFAVEGDSVRLVAGLDDGEDD